MRLPTYPETLTLREWYRWLRADGWPAGEAVAEARRVLGWTVAQHEACWVSVLNEVLVHASEAMKKRPPAPPDRTQTPVFSMFMKKRNDKPRR
jgi:hypothetical protein